MATPLQPMIQSRILNLRNQRVMLDADLAQLYGVETRAVVQAVKRNAVRFPADFMFQLDAPEWDALRSQTVISNVSGPGRGGRRTAPYAFTALEDKKDKSTGTKAKAKTKAVGKKT
jgi:hypothetical protein